MRIRFVILFVDVPGPSFSSQKTVRTTYRALWLYIYLQIEPVRPVVVLMFLRTCARFNRASHGILKKKTAIYITDTYHSIVQSTRLLSIIPINVSQSSVSRERKGKKRRLCFCFDFYYLVKSACSRIYLSLFIKSSPCRSVLNIKPLQNL